MENSAGTRSANRHDHLLQTPDTFVRAPLPGMRNATAIVHIGPARGAGFTGYSVELDAGGSFESGPSQAFIYVIEGELTLAMANGEYQLAADRYAYLPSGSAGAITALNPARVMVIEKPYAAGPGSASYFSGDERKTAGLPLLGDDAVQVRTLFPEDTAYDFAVNTMTFQPGATLPAVEIHVMEHGLMMLEGEGIYRLAKHWYPVKAGDFIWMAPFCPQWFCALGRKPARYLIYKDWNRHPLHSR